MWQWCVDAYWQKQTSFELKNRKIQKNVTWRLEIKYVGWLYTSYTYNTIHSCTSIRLWSSFWNEIKYAGEYISIPLSESLYIGNCMHSHKRIWYQNWFHRILWLNCLASNSYTLLFDWSYFALNVWFLRLFLRGM